MTRQEMLDLMDILRQDEVNPENEVDEPETVLGREGPEYVMELGVCEIPHLILHPGRLYRFKKIEGCAACEKYLQGD